MRGRDRLQGAVDVDVLDGRDALARGRVGDRDAVGRQAEARDDAIRDRNGSRVRGDEGLVRGPGGGLGGASGQTMPWRLRKRMLSSLSVSTV